jgi:hypothetical protein
MVGPVDWTRISKDELEALTQALSIDSSPNSCIDSYGDSSQTNLTEHKQARNDVYVLVLIDANSHPVSTTCIKTMTITDVVSSFTLSQTPSIV